MSWFRLDDAGAFHAKVIRAGNEAYGAWCRAGQWCSAHAPNGFIPVEVAHLIAAPKVWAKAFAAGLLDSADESGYQIHDFNEYNPTEAQVEERKARVSAARAAAGKIGGLKSGRARSKALGEPKQIASTDAEQNEAIASSKTRFASSNDEANGSNATKQNEAPSRPVPDQIPPTPVGGGFGSDEPETNPQSPTRPVTDSALARDLLETFEQTIRDATGQPYAAAPGGLRAMFPALQHLPNRRAPVGDLRAWTRTATGDFLRAKRIGQGREPADFVRWLNAGRPAAPTSPTDPRAAVAAPEPLRKAFNPAMEP